MRPGLVVGITIPLVLAVTFLAMDYWGIGLHKISLGSLIIALGLLVDDAIIAVEMMVRKMEEGYDKVRAATFAYEITAMPMLTGTLITAAGFLPIGMAKSTVGEYTFAIFAVTVIALVTQLAGVGLLRAVPRHAAAEGQAGAPSDAPRALRHAVLRALPPHGGLVRGAPLDHHRRHASLTFALGIVGMGKVQQQFFPDSSRPEIMVDIWFPEGTSFAANEDDGQAGRSSACAASRASTAVSTWVGSGVPRFYLPLDQMFPQTNVSQFIVLPQGPASCARRCGVKMPALLAQRVPRGARPRQAAAQRAAGAVSGAVPGRSAPILPRVRERGRRGQGRDARQPQHARRQRQLERVGQGAAAGRRPGQGARAGRDQPVDRAGRRSTILSGTTVGQYREGDKLIDIVLRQPLDERNAITDLGNAYLPTASGKSIPLDADRQAGVRLGAGRDVAREPRLRDHGAGRHRRRHAGRHRHRRSCCRS